MSFLKSVDLQGRITLPIELLRVMGIKHNQLLDISRQKVNGKDSIVLARYNPGCFICGKMAKQTFKVDNQEVCIRCFNTLKEQFDVLEAKLNENAD